MYQTGYGIVYQKEETPPDDGKWAIWNRDGDKPRVANSLFFADIVCRNSAQFFVYLL